MANDNISVTDYVRGLREIADFYEKNPDTPLPYAGEHKHFYEKAEFVKAIAALARGGRVDKYVYDTWGDLDGKNAEYRARRSFNGVEVIFSIDRKKLCRLIQPAVYDCPDSLLAEEAAEFVSEGK